MDDSKQAASEQPVKQWHRLNGGLFNEIEFLFVGHWRGNASKAAKLAGYKGDPTVAGARLMRKPWIKEALLLKQRMFVEESAKLWAANPEPLSLPAHMKPDGQAA